MKKSYFFKVLGSVVFIQLMLLSTNAIAQNKYALDFNGTDESIYMSDNNNKLDVTTDWTFECWINVDSYTETGDYEQCIMYRKNVFQFALRDKNATGSGDFGLYFYDINSSITLGTGANENLSLNTWYHVAATYDGTTSRLFVDGTEVDNSTGAWNLIGSTNNFNIAAKYDGGYSNYFNGQIDEVRLSDDARATSAMQLSTHEEEYVSDANTVFLMHYDDQANTPTYISEVGYAGTVYPHNISSDDYLYGEVANAKLLRPEYRSKVTGDWNASASWQYDNTGAANWVDASLTPSNYDDVITILNGHTVTVSADVEIDQTTIASGGQVTVSTGNTLSIDNGTGTDLTIDGTLRKEGTGVVLCSGTLAFSDGGKFELTGTNKYIPEATWHDNSTCEITGAIGGDMSSTYHTDQEFGNFTWNCTGQTSDIYFSGALTNIDGDFTLISTNTYEFRFTGSSGVNTTVNIAGNVDIQGGTLNLTSGSNLWYMVCKSNFTQSGGTIKADGGGTGYLRFGPTSGSGFSGDFTHSGGTFTPEDIQVNTSYALTLASNMNIGTAPLTINGTFIIPLTYILTIPSGGVATATGTLTNNAGTTGLVIQSDATGTGSLILSSGSPSATVQRYITHYTTNDNGWHFLSSPVTSQAIQPNFVTDPPTSTVDFYYYDETASSENWINSKTLAGAWNSSFDASFIVGKGYLVAYPTPSVTKSFSGSINTGSKAEALDYTTGSPGIGWNLLGNPYTSAIDWDLLTKTASIDGSVYVIRASDGTYISWNTASQTGDLTDGIIPAMQGYFVKTTATGQTVTMETGDQVHNSTNFYKSGQYLTEKTIKVSVGYGDYVNNTYIQLRDDATTIFDNAFDAYKLFGYSRQPQIFTNDGSTLYSINCLPIDMDSYSLPLNIRIQETGEHQLTFNEIENISDLFVLKLEDLKTNNTVTVTSELIYPFTYTEGDGEDRYILHFSNITDVDENQNTPENTVSIYSTGNSIFVKNLKGNKLSGTVTVSNIIGQVVYKQELNNRNQDIINTNLNTGIYIVSVKMENGYVISEKVIIQ